MADGSSGGSSNYPSLRPGRQHRRASGGYASFGQYTLGEGGTEFVLNNQTTFMMEKLLGGPLSQNSVMNGMNRSSGGAAINPTFIFNDRDDKNLIIQEVSRVIDKALNDYTEGHR